jgi:hypothetical protein
VESGFQALHDVNEIEPHRRLRMIYALFTLAVLGVLGALWRRHWLALPLLLATLAALSAFLVSDMTTPLTLSF